VLFLTFALSFLIIHSVEVTAAYKAREDYAEGITDIYILLAAKEILSLAKTKTLSFPAEQVTAIVKRCLENLKSSEAEKLLNEYIWVLKGFYECLQSIFLLFCFLSFVYPSSFFSVVVVSEL
jgi:hypothetical protein